MRGTPQQIIEKYNQLARDAQLGNDRVADLVGGAGSNRAAVGAQVRIGLCSGEVLTREVEGGHGHVGLQNERIVHFGLGSLEAVQVEIAWPDADRTVETHTLTTGARYRIEQGGAPEAL